MLQARSIEFSWMLKSEGKMFKRKNGIFIVSKYYLPNLLRIVVLLTNDHRSFDRSLSKRWSPSPLTLSVAELSDLHLRNRAQNRKIVTFLATTILTMWTRLKSPAISCVDIISPMTYVMRRAHHFCGILPKIYNLSLLRRKQQTDSNWGKF